MQANAAPQTLAHFLQGFLSALSSSKQSLLLLPGACISSLLCTLKQCPCPFLMKKSLGFLELMQFIFFLKLHYYVTYSMFCLIMVFLKQVDMKSSC